MQTRMTKVRGKPVREVARAADRRFVLAGLVSKGYVLVGGPTAPVKTLCLKGRTIVTRQTYKVFSSVQGGCYARGVGKGAPVLLVLTRRANDGQGVCVVVFQRVVSDGDGMPRMLLLRHSFGDASLFDGTVLEGTWDDAHVALDDATWVAGRSTDAMSPQARAAAVQRVCSSVVANDDGVPLRAGVWEACMDATALATMLRDPLVHHVLVATGVARWLLLCGDKTAAYVRDD